MATSVITNTLLDLDGVTPLVGVTVVARLLGATRFFRASDSAEVAREKRAVTNGAGVWSLTLERTGANLTPAGSFYEIEELVPDRNGGVVISHIAVGAGNANLFASLINTPPAGADVSTYLTQTAGDARYRALANLITASQVAADIATQAELDAHAAAVDPHAGYRLESALITAADVAADVATQAELDAVNAAAAHLSGAETFTGAKTFSLAPVVPDASFTQAKVINLVADLAAKANDNAVVHLALAETLTGAKTFTAGDTLFGAGAAGAAGTFVSVGSLGDPANVWMDARGTPVDIGINLRPKGAGATSLKAGDLAIDAGTLRLFAVHVRTTSANAGTSGAPPAQVDGYITVRLDGASKKIPYYAA